MTAAQPEGALGTSLGNRDCHKMADKGGANSLLPSPTAKAPRGRKRGEISPAVQSAPNLKQVSQIA